MTVLNVDTLNDEYQDGYDNGYQDGESSGYDDGFVDGERMAIARFRELYEDFKDSSELEIFLDAIERSVS